jgi:hypothetical protein
LRNLLTLLFGAKFDPPTLWTAAIALLTLIGVLVAWRQLAGIRATSRADFTFRFIESFFTAETRTLFTLLINSALTFDVREITDNGKPDGKRIDRLPYLRINDAVVSQVTGIVSPLPNKAGYSALEVDDLLLGHFESLGWYVRKKLIDFDAAWSNFSYYLTTTFEHPEIRKYLADPDNADEDTYSDFLYLYERFCKEDTRRERCASIRKAIRRTFQIAGIGRRRINPMPDRRENLLDVPLLSPTEEQAYITDLRALQEGKIREFGGPEYWQRVTTEMLRRQANAQIRAANSLKHATWALALFTALLVVVTLLPIALRTWRH